MAQGLSDTILVAIRITLRIRESKVRKRILRIGGGLCSLSTSCFIIMLAAMAASIAVSVKWWPFF